MNVEARYINYPYFYVFSPSQLGKNTTVFNQITFPFAFPHAPIDFYVLHISN